MLRFSLFRTEPTVVHISDHDDRDVAAEAMNQSGPEMDGSDPVLVDNNDLTVWFWEQGHYDPTGSWERDSAEEHRVSRKLEEVLW